MLPLPYRSKSAYVFKCCHSPPKLKLWFPAVQFRVSRSWMRLNLVLCGIRKLAPSCTLGKRISFPTASPAGLVTGLSGLKAGMEFRNQSPWNMKLLTIWGEMIRVHVAKGEWKRLKDDCRSAAVPNGLRRLPLSTSLERLKEYRTIKLSFSVNLKSNLVDSRRSWTNAGAEVLTTDDVAKSRSPTGTAWSWCR